MVERVAERLGDLLGTEKVAGSLGAGRVAVYRRCREGPGGARCGWASTRDGRVVEGAR